MRWKLLPGSRRDTTTGVHLVAVGQHQLGVVLGQACVTGGDGELGTLLELLRTVPRTVRNIHPPPLSVPSVRTFTIHPTRRTASLTTKLIQLEQMDVPYHTG